MPLIEQQKTDTEKTPWRIRLRASIADEIEAYCQWAGIKYRDYFIEQACSHIFRNDHEWIEHKSRTKK